MTRERTLYSGPRFSVTEHGVHQDDGNWVALESDGRVRSKKNYQYREHWVNKVPGDALWYYGDYDVLNRAYCLAWNEAESLINPDGIILTGDNWPTVWTRDMAYSTDLGLGLWNVEFCRRSLDSKIAHGEIVQDTGTGGSWPISTDRVVWAVPVWELYCLSGDKAWLEKTYGTLCETCRKDDEVIRTIQGLYKGESSILDWREQTYPAWMTAADIGDSVSHSTMVLHYHVRQVLSHMAKELGREEEAATWEAKAKELAELIENHFRLSDSPLYGQYLYGRGYPVLSPTVDTMGNMLAVLTGMLKGQRAKEVFEALPHGHFGIPCIHPQMSPEVPTYHNRATWPFIEAYYGLLAAQLGNDKAFNRALACLVRAALLHGTNKENLHTETGIDEGLLLSSDRQLWSIAGLMGCFYKGLFGIRVTADALYLKPCVPESLAGTHVLTNLKYRGQNVDISLRGWGREVKSCRINGREAVPRIPIGLSERIHIEIELEPGEDRASDLPITEVQNNLTIPEWQAVSGDKLTWRAVDGACGYRIYRNGQVIADDGVCEHLLKAPIEGQYQVQAYSADGRVSYLNEPYEIMDADARQETRPCFVRADMVWDSTLESQPDAQFFSVYVEKAGVYRLDAYYANGTYSVTDGNTCGLRSLYLNEERVGTLAFPHTGDWGRYIYSTSVEVKLEPGTYRICLKVDKFSENMNKKINNLVIKNLRFSRIH